MSFKPHNLPSGSLAPPLYIISKKELLRACNMPVRGETSDPELPNNLSAKGGLFALSW